MSEITITVPRMLAPRADSPDVCDCKKKPILTTYKTGTLVWHKQVGQPVAEGEAVCQVEFDKRIADIPAPAAGVLARQLVPDYGSFTATTPLGVIESGAEPPGAH